MFRALPTEPGNPIKARVCDGVMNTHQSRFGLVERALARDFGLMESFLRLFVWVLFLYFNSFRSAF